MDTSRLRQSTNFWTLFEMSMLPVSFFLMVSLAFSACSRLRLFTSTWSATRSASALCSMKYTSSWERRKSVMASCMKRFVMAFFVWFS